MGQKSNKQTFWVIFHSWRWLELVSQGYVTHVVEDGLDGIRYAHMVPSNWDGRR
jgi:hypothetical protein